MVRRSESIIQSETFSHGIVLFEYRLSIGLDIVSVPTLDYWITFILSDISRVIKDFYFYAIQRFSYRIKDTIGQWKLPGVVIVHIRFVNAHSE